MDLKTYADLAKHLSASFTTLAKDSARLDIVFDLYLDASIKQEEHLRRSKDKATEVKKFQLPSGATSYHGWFWASSSNKMQLQKICIKCVIDTYDGTEPVYLGGANDEDMTSCLKILNNEVSQQPLLKCNHEEADDRILFHINHGVRHDCLLQIIIASPYTDVVVNAVHHFSRWMYFNLEDLWVITSKVGSKQVFPVHELVDVIDDD